MNFMLNDGTPDGTPPVVEPVVEPVEVIEQPTPTRNDLLRELSKEHGVNLFEPDGIKAFKEFQESQKSDLQKKEEALNSYKEKELSWQQKELEYQSKLEASKLNIPEENMNDALKLADNDPTKLAEIVKKYPMLVNASSGEVRIGVQDPQSNSTPSGLSEAERYMAEHYEKVNGRYVRK